MIIQTAPKELYKRQLACVACPKSGFVIPILKWIPQCKQCKCLLKPKQNFKFSSCPLQKW
jgi:hypothetical protein